MKQIVCTMVFILTLGLFGGCSKVSDEDLSSARKAVKNGAVIVDVRTAQEFKVKHIAGAINIPIDSISKNGINIPKKREIVLYCQTGSRSSMAAGILRKNGWVVHDVATQSDWERKIEAK